MLQGSMIIESINSDDKPFCFNTKEIAFISKDESMTTGVIRLFIATKSNFQFYVSDLSLYPIIVEAMKRES